ncbi:hypothetical protein V8J83_02810 [Gymnodinialimonas sp. 2307UL20-7]
MTDRVFLILLCLGVSLAAPARAFAPEDCSENYVADGLPAETRVANVPEYFVEPGQIGGDLICTLVPGEAEGAPVIQVSERMANSAHGAFVQYFPNRMQVLRTQGPAAGLMLTLCGPIPDDLPRERHPGGVWCRVDLSPGRGVTLDLEYDAGGALAWLNFEVSAGPEGMVAGSTLAPLLPQVAPQDLRAAVFLPKPDVTHLLELIRGPEVFRLVTPQDLLTLHSGLRNDPQEWHIVVETGAPQTGPFAQIVLSSEMLADAMAELALLEGLIRTDRGP